MIRSHIEARLLCPAPVYLEAWVGKVRAFGRFHVHEGQVPRGDLLPVDLLLMMRYVDTSYRIEMAGWRDWGAARVVTGGVEYRTSEQEEKRRKLHGQGVIL